LTPATNRLTIHPCKQLRGVSERNANGTAAARAYARECGLEWDTLDDDRKVGLAKRGVQGDPRQPKQDDLGCLATSGR
jgi:hypothetical protein